MTCILNSIAQPNYSEATCSVAATIKGSCSTHFLKQYLVLENIAAEVVASQASPVEPG